MDVFMPRSAPTATILFVHGGSLQASGQRRVSAVYRDVCAPFVVAGIACASMDYRLAPSNRWPAMPDDVAAAVLRLRGIVASARGNPARLFLFGHSSGCHLVAILSTNREYLRKVGLTPAVIAGTIAMGCTLDRDDAELRRLTPDMIRRSFAAEPMDVATYGTPENWLAANPASYVGRHVPPTLVVVACEERFFPSILEQGARFVRRLLEVQVPADVVIVPGNHLGSVAAIGRPGDPTFSAIRRFISAPQALGKSGTWRTTVASCG